MDTKNTSRFAWRPYVVAITVVAAAAALRVWPLHVLGVSLTWLTFYPAVMVAALYGGSSAALLGTFLSCLAVLFVLPPFVHGPFIRDSPDWLGLAVFFATCTMISGIAEATRRAQAREKQAEAERDRFFTLSLDLLCVAGFDGYFKRLNPVWERVLGWSTEELLSKPLLEFVHPDDREATIREIQNQQRGEAVLSFRNRYRCKDGSYRWLSWKSIPVEKQSLMYAAGRDITESKEQEEATRKQEAKFRGLLEAAPNAILGINPKGIIEFANLQTEKLFGYTREELVGESIDTLLPERHREAHVQHRSSYFHQPRLRPMGPGLDLWARRKDGSEFPVEIGLSPLETEEGVIVISVITDITERKRTEEGIRRLNEDLGQRTADLEVSNKELEAFTYSVSHDLRAPLRHIDGFSKLLMEGHSSELTAEAREFLSLIRDSTLEMSQLVDDLLNLARIGRRELSLQVTGLKTLVEGVVSNLKAGNASRAIEWKVQPLPFVECDPSLMKQVFINLLSNAVKFTRQRELAVIEVGLIQQDNQSVIFVRDNGVGFDMKYVGKLFAVFQRLHRQEDFEGTGIGLAIVHRVIQKHGGRVWAEGELNKGAVFYFTLGTPTEADS